MKTKGSNEFRRQFLRFLAASPLATLPAGYAWGYPERATPESLQQVLNILQLDRVARKTMPLEAYHFVSAASDDGDTLTANRDAYARVKMRPRRLVDVSRVDTSIELFGRRYDSPIFLAPAGDQQRVHAAGELATARAAQARSTLMICSMMSNASISEITAVTGDYWMQLYPSPDKAFLAHLLQAAEGSGCQAVVLTVDGPARGNHEAERWFRSMRKPGSKRRIAPLGNFSSYQGPRRIGDPSLTWEGLGWFKKNSKLPLLLKGVMTREDARLCLDAGVDGLVVSNHGGRQEGSSRGTLDVLPEIVAEVQGRIPVLLDGGIRRGSDALKALAIGADAVCIGRPYLWGLGAFGEEGVARALSILQTELVREMTYAGVPSLAAINKGYVWIDE